MTNDELRNAVTELCLAALNQGLALGAINYATQWAMKTASDVDYARIRYKEVVERHGIPSERLLKECQWPKHAVPSKRSEH